MRIIYGNPPEMNFAAHDRACYIYHTRENYILAYIIYGVTLPFLLRARYYTAPRTVVVIFFPEKYKRKNVWFIRVCCVYVCYACKQIVMYSGHTLARYAYIVHDGVPHSCDL